MSKGREENVPRWGLHCHVLRMSRALCKIYYYSRGGKNRPHFFSNLCAEKNDPCNTDYPRLLVDYWEAKLLWQYYVILHIKIIYTKNINQTTKYRLSLLWWISSRMSIDNGNEKNSRLLFNFMFNGYGCKEQY